MNKSLNNQRDKKQTRIVGLENADDMVPMVDLTQNPVPVSNETSETNEGRTIPRMGRPGYCITGRYIKQLAKAKKTGFLEETRFLAV